MKIKLPFYIFFFIIVITFLLGLFIGIYYEQAIKIYLNKFNKKEIGSMFLQYIFPFLFIIISALIGYLFGSAKSFREEKQKAYGELLSPILKVAYNHDNGNRDENDFNKALTKLWLYGSKKVTYKMEQALSILHHPGKEADITKCFQEAVVEMRDDIQIWPWQKINPKDVNHLYTQITKQ
jgi:hypothetical protein